MIRTRMHSGRATAAVAVLLCAAHTATARDLPDTAPVSSWTAIATPIARSALLSVLDLDPDLSRTLTLVQAVRRLHEDDTRRGTLRTRLITALLAAGESPRRTPVTGKAAQDATTVGTAAETGTAESGGVDDNMVPLPLTEKFWESCIVKPRKVRGSVGAAILTDPAVGFMYVALASTDAATRLFLAGECDRVSAIARTRAAAFSVVARSFRVRDGRTIPPGGDAALPLWTRLGLPLTDPSAFLMRLVSADAGRLAYFYDTIAQLDPARQRFALGLAEPADADMAIGEAIYRLCAGSDPSWSIVDRPFARMTVDVAFVLQQVRLTPDGRLAGPGTDAFLSAVFADGDVDRGVDDAAALLTGPTVDAASLVRLVIVPDWTRRRARLMTVLFAQRMFADLQPADASAALIALRGVSRVETLPFALERIGVRSPAVIAAAVRRSLLFGPPVGRVAVVPAERQRAEISGFQASLALIERLVYARALDGAAATGLIERLLDERQPDPLGYLAHVARWMANGLLPQVPRRQPPLAGTPDTGPGPEPAVLIDTAQDGREHQLLDVLAGPPLQTPTLVRWENTPYRIDLAAADRVRLHAIRARQGGPTLDDALDLIESARTLREAGDSADLSTVRATIVRLANHLAPNESGDGAQAGAPADSRPVLSAAAQALESPNASAGIRIQHARRLAEVGATVLGDVLRSIVYACALGDAEGQAFLAGDVSRLHEFGLDEPDASRRRVRTWELPVDVGAGGQPWHLSGSLLAVDLSMSRFALRRALGEMPTRQPTLSGPDRRTLVATMALMNPADLSDGTRTVLVGAMRRGREVLEAALQRPEIVEETVRAAGITGWRAQLLPWARAFEPDAVLSMVARSELVWLGVRQPLPDDVDRWGAPTQPIDGAWRLRFPGPEATDDVAGRQASAYLPGRFVDLTLRLAEVMAEIGMPSPLTREVLRAALQRFVDEVRPAYPDDWLALVRYANGLPRTQVEDYVYGMTVPDGPLVPADVPAVQP
jgi:hypothetical protein